MPRRSPARWCRLARGPPCAAAHRSPPSCSQARDPAARHRAAGAQGPHAERGVCGCCSLLVEAEAAPTWVLLAGAPTCAAGCRQLSTHHPAAGCSLQVEWRQLGVQQSRGWGEVAGQATRHVAMHAARATCHTPVLSPSCQHSLRFRARQLRAQRLSTQTPLTISTPLALGCSDVHHPQARAAHPALQVGPCRCRHPLLWCGAWFPSCACLHAWSNRFDASQPSCSSVSMHCPYDWRTPLRSAQAPAGLRRARHAAAPGPDGAVCGVRQLWRRIGLARGSAASKPVAAQRAGE